MSLYNNIIDFFKDKSKVESIPYHIREATIEDKENIRTILLEFHKVSPYSSIEINTDKTTEFITRAITDLTCKTFIATLNGTIIGIIIGIIVEFPFSREKNGQEIIWYVTPQHRGYIGKELYYAFYEWCLSKEVSVVVMATPTDNYRLKAFYTSIGYTPTEDVYMLYIHKDIPWLPLQ